MLSWPMFGTTTGAVLCVHAVLFVTRRLFPHAPMTMVALVTAEIIVWGYGSLTSGWSITRMLLWTSNGLIVKRLSNRWCLGGKPGRLH
ncbi:hypothetical protein BXT84_06545 [Sulfobacillus thermotolerans]|uniref:Uncharacterized protein n=1 Tax=Sulfobacillus thermotolerans TaxID=338644 RepID=A0ABN5GYN6_9FIRM|nr:hypothetical protein BXT84_06545 [Sulfobacillus thermotolerans]